VVDLNKILASEVRTVFVRPERFDSLLYCREVLVQNANFHKRPFNYQMDCEVLAWSLISRSIQGQTDLMRMWFLRHGPDHLDGIDFPPRIFPEHADRLVDVLSIKPRTQSAPPYGPRKISREGLRMCRARRDEAVNFFDAKRVVDGIPPRKRPSLLARWLGRK
jgi:hypothetical protein